MKLRLSSRNSERAARNSLIAALFFLILGCSAPPGPSYTIKNLSESLTKICKNEYNIPIVSRLKEQTLWIYLPLEEELFIDTDKPLEYSKKFEVKSIDGSLAGGLINLDYGIQEIPEAKESQNKKFNPQVMDKINKILRSLRRVVFSLRHDGYEPKFFIVAASDIKNGVELIETTYIDDLKKAFYGIISWSEYQQRSLQDIRVSPEAIGDFEGRHIKFQDIDFKEFLVGQIKQRIRLKFNRAEAEKGANIDREVLKSIKNVLEIYKFKDFLVLDLKNLITDNKTSLSRAAVFEKIKE
jgi:hypothetical protein